MTVQSAVTEGRVPFFVLFFFTYTIQYIYIYPLFTLFFKSIIASNGRILHGTLELGHWNGMGQYTYLYVIVTISCTISNFIDIMNSLHDS